MNKEIFDYFDYLFSNPKCELNYKNDYELLIAIVLSAQTTDKRVNKVTLELFSKYPDINSLALGNITDIEKIIRELGTSYKKSKYIHDIAVILRDNGYDYVPNNREFLLKLPGVGRKTCNVFLANIYNVPAIAVDTHVERVSKRLGLAKENDDVLTVEKKLMKKIPKDKWIKLHHQMVLFGRYYCKAKNPDCKNCKISKYCKKKESI